MPTLTSIGMKLITTLVLAACAIFAQAPQAPPKTHLKVGDAAPERNSASNSVAVQSARSVIVGYSSPTRGIFFSTIPA